MNDTEFEEYMRAAMHALVAAQDELHERYGIGAFTRWGHDVHSETLHFSDATGRKGLEAHVVALGSYASSSGTWQWAWANPSIPEAVREKSSALRALAHLTGMGLFAAEEAFALDDEHTAWELVAMCVHHLSAIGAYRAPAPSSHEPHALFLAITDIRRSDGQGA